MGSDVAMGAKTIGEGWSKPEPCRNKENSGPQWTTSGHDHLDHKMIAIKGYSAIYNLSQKKAGTFVENV